MCIYGVNFNGTAIPEGFARKLAKRIKVNGVWFYLKGVATDAEARDMMLVQANNGHRKLHVVERKTAGSPIFGIYCD